MKSHAIDNPYIYALCLKEFISRNHLKIHLKILFSFYSKEMSSKYFVPFRSAYSQSMKRQMLANEGLRQLLNMSPELEWNESAKVMNDFSVKMWRSGYPSSWREEAVKSVKPDKLP